MKSSSQKGTASGFYLSELGVEAEDFFQEMNAFMVIPSHDSVLVTKIHEKNYKENHWEDHPSFAFDDDEFHMYQIEWTPEYISYSVDEREIRRYEGYQPRDSYHLKMSVMSLDPRGFETTLDASKLPTQAEVDYVEVYNYNSEEGNFSLRYRDDFDTFNTKRWSKGDNETWVDMTSTFQKDQAFVCNGHLVLSLDVNEHPEHRCDAEPSDEPNFHVLPAPKEGTLDAAIEMATRAAVTMVRTQLENISYNMTH